MKKSVVVVAVAVILIVILQFIPDFYADYPAEVRLVTVREESYTPTFLVDGVVEDTFQREVTPKFPFVPKQVLVEEGEYVTYGQLIATVDVEGTKNAFLSIAEEYAGQLPDDLLSDAAEAVFNMAGGNSWLADGNLPTEIRSNMEGVLSSVTLHTGELWLPTQAAAVVSSMNGLRVRLSVPEQQVSSLKIGQRITFTAPAVEDGLFAARITWISSEASQKLDGLTSTTVVEVLARIEDDFDVLRPGYTVRAECAAEEEQEYQFLPYEAVLQDETGQSYVYVYQDGKAWRRDIETGKELSTAVAVEKGLGKYEKVILDADQVNDSDPVVMAED